MKARPASHVEVEVVGGDLLLLDTRSREVAVLSAEQARLVDAQSRILQFTGEQRHLLQDLVQRGLIEPASSFSESTVSRRGAVLGAAATGGAVFASLAMPSVAMASSVTVAGEGTWSGPDSSYVYFSVRFLDFVPPLTSSWYNTGSGTGSSITVPGGTGLDYAYYQPGGVGDYLFEWTVDATAIIAAGPAWLTDRTEVVGTVSRGSDSIHIRFLPQLV